jgi:uncharacterized repeat protein (TIGR01451 family)/LPXTG-motif cell wall-anchored protein
MWSTSKESVMNKLIAAIRRAPKRAASLAIVAAAVLVPAALFAWGPDRPTFTVEHPAPYVTFNSITNNPQHGDERNFVQIKEATASNTTYAEDVPLQAGKDYQVSVFYHNNAASNLNDAAHDYKGVAKNAFMRIQMPATVNAGEKARITGFVGASNANPAQVWDEAYGSANGNFALRYVPGSATIYNNGATNGKSLPDSLYTTGTPLGYDALDGTLPGCNQYAGYVTFKIHVDQPNFEVQKQVSKAGTNTYAESVTALPNEEVEYKIQYKNTGTTKQNDVIIKDKLPAGVAYVNGSTQVATSATNGQWSPITDNGVVARGINIGSYLPSGNAYVKFKAKVVDNSQLEKCGVNTLINTATAETNNGSKSDTANVVVSKTCEEQPAKYTCDSLTVTKIDRTNFKFDTKYTVQNATFKSVTYVIRDAAGKEIARTNTPSYTQSQPAKYSVEAIVTVTVNGQDKTAPVGNCKQPFEVTTTPEECKPGIPVNDDRCKETPECKPGIPMNDSRCSETCVSTSTSTNTCETAPTELPHTGASDGFIALVGAGSLIASIGYYIASRRAITR